MPTRTEPGARAAADGNGSHDQANEEIAFLHPLILSENWFSVALDELSSGSQAAYGAELRLRQQSTHYFCGCP
jgi:hypothetical protein